MKKQLLCVAALASLAGTANADDFLGYQNGFADINVNYLDWSHRTETKSENTTRKKILPTLS